MPQKHQKHPLGARPYWNGHIRISLIAFPVSVYSAINRQSKITMHEIYRPTGKRIHHQNVADGMPVDKEDIVKGYEYAKNSYVFIEPEEIDAIKIPSKQILEIIQFVDAEEIDPLYYDKPYYVTPSSDIAGSAYTVIREALYRSRKLAMGQICMRGKEYICAIGPMGRGLLMQVLRYNDELRDSRKFFANISDDLFKDEEVELAEELINRKTEAFDLSLFHDHYKDALHELIEAKIENRRPYYEDIRMPAPKVINLMDALKSSLGEDGRRRYGRR